MNRITKGAKSVRVDDALYTSLAIAWLGAVGLLSVTGAVAAPLAWFVPLLGPVIVFGVLSLAFWGSAVSILSCIAILVRCPSRRLPAVAALCACCTGAGLAVAQVSHIATVLRVDPVINGVNSGRLVVAEEAFASLLRDTEAAAGTTPAGVSVPVLGCVPCLRFR